MGFLAVFRCFGSELSASDIPFVAEILGSRRYSERKNSEAPAVLLLFSAVFIERCR
jgi:hypothetical protein